MPIIISTSDVAVKEGSGTVEVVFRLSAASTSQVTFNFLASNATAIAADYSLNGVVASATDATTRQLEAALNAIVKAVNANSGVVIFAPGETSKTVRFNITDDKLAETSEKFVLQLSNPVNAILDQASVNVVILDDDQAMGSPNAVNVISMATAATANAYQLPVAASNDFVIGTSAFDTVVIAGNRSAYDIKTGTNGVTVYNRAGTGGLDTLVGIEKIKFDDQYVNLTIQKTSATLPAAAVLRLEELYVAFFNRVPDADGLEYWIKQYRDGQSINQIAESFFNAGKAFTSLTGYSDSMTEEDFVNLVYRNVLGRKDGADAEGLKFWSTQLRAKQETHGSLVSAILDSAHTFKNRSDYGYVADFLDNKGVVSHYAAVQQGINYNTSDLSISQGMAIAAAITPTSTAAAITLIGLDSTAVIST